MTYKSIRSLYDTDAGRACRGGGDDLQELFPLYDTYAGRVCGVGGDDLQEHVLSV